MGKKSKPGKTRRSAQGASADTRDSTVASRHPQPWSHYEELLQGLLSIQIQEPFVDRDHLSPQRAWLVLHLDLVRPIATIHNVLDALAVLCVRSELPHQNEAQRDSFWRDVLTSDVMRDVPSADAPSVFHFVAATRAKGLHVLLSWRGKRFQSVVATHVRTFLMAPLAKYEDAASAGTSSRRLWRRPLRVGIQFGDALMAREDLQTVKRMLTYHVEDAAPVPRLCEQHTLQHLDLNGNRMDACELSVLSSLLEDPQCRRIDALDLSNTFPKDATEKNYISAFRRVACAVVTSKSNLNPIVRTDAGVALSLAHNTLLGGVHLQALYDALANATRPLRGLSLAYTTTTSSTVVESQSSLTRKWFARICMTSPVASFAKDCVLDITCADVNVAPHNMDAFHEQLIGVVVAAVPRIQQALAQNQSIYCRLRKPLHASIPIQNADYLQIHTVLQIREDGFCLVALPTSTQTVEGAEDADQIEMDGVTILDGEGVRACWVPPQWLSSLYSDDDNNAIVRMRFSSLICHGDNDAFIRFQAPDSAFLGGFLASVGPEIQRLALRRWHDLAWILPRLLPLCPRLRELDVQSSRLIYGTRLSLWELLSDAQLAQLEVVNVAGTDVNVAFVETLLQRVDRVTSLRYLSMVDCTLSFDQLSLLRRFLQLHKRLELLEMDAGGVPSSANDEMTPTRLAMAISRDHDHEQLQSTPLATNRQRVMVAWCLSKIPHFQHVESKVPAAVVQQCNAFAGDLTTRRIRWCSVVRLARWVLATRPR